MRIITFWTIILSALTYFMAAALFLGQGLKTSRILDYLAALLLFNAALTQVRLLYSETR